MVRVLGIYNFGGRCNIEKENHSFTRKKLKKPFSKVAQKNSNPFFSPLCHELPKRPKHVPKCGLFCILAFLEKLHFTNSFLCWKESLVPDSAPWYIPVPSEGLKYGDRVTKKYT